jgi:hypothetical protein
MAIIKRVDLADFRARFRWWMRRGLPSPMFLRFLNTTVRALKNGINNLIDVQNAVDAANARLQLANCSSGYGGHRNAGGPGSGLVNSYITPSSV